MKTSQQILLEALKDGSKTIGQVNNLMPARTRREAARKLIDQEIITKEGKTYHLAPMGELAMKPFDYDEVAAKLDALSYRVPVRPDRPPLRFYFVWVIACFLAAFAGTYVGFHL